MKIINPFQINDWPIKKFLIIIISFQLLFWGSIGLDLIGLGIPILRQLICFVYLCFIPGSLVLRILNLHKLENVECLLYTIGLSIFILIFAGLFTNLVYPSMGILKPISIIPLTFTLSFIVLILCIFCYVLDNNFSEPSYIVLKEVFSVPSLFLYLIPFLTIIGTYLANYHGNSSLLMVVILLISSITILVCSNIIPSSLYPLAIFVISISMLFHNSLISKYLVGWDIQIEYKMANYVISNSLWDSSIYSNVNSMLSVVMLAPIYSILLNLSLTWVFKIVYPMIFSLLPLGLYRIFQKQTSEKIAFMSVFFFMSFFVYYTEMLQLARQQIAEYFFVLLILLIINDKLPNVPRHILLILFGFSIIVSHYGISYIIAGSFICSLVLLHAASRYVKESLKNNTITFTFTLLFFTFLIAWYIYTSESSAIRTIVALTNNILNNLISDFFNPDKVQALHLISKKAVSPIHEFSKYMQIFTQVCISIGLLYIIKYRKLSNYYKFNNEYLSLCIVFYMILLVAISVPNFSSALNTSRLYQITLILLSPFCVIGGIIALQTLYLKVFQLDVNKKDSPALNILSIFFAVFLLFNTGWIYEITGDIPTSISFNNTVDYPKFNEQDVSGKEWMYKVNDLKEGNGYFYADYYRWLLLLNSFERNLIRIFPKSDGQIPKNSYLYFSTYNIHENEILIRQQVGVNDLFEYVNIYLYISSKNQIYNNGGAKIYYQ